MNPAAAMRRDDEAREKKLRSRNWALFGILVAVGALLFVITIIRIGQQL